MIPSDFASYVPLIKLEIGRLHTPAMRRVAECTHVELVLAETWLSHLDEAYVGELGSAGADLERLASAAVCEIHGFLTVAAPVWIPGARRPQALHRAVDHMIRIRIQATGGGCEACHKPAPLELHHLHYQNFGYELPFDVVRLCRDCHLRRHRMVGWPRDSGWRDWWQWSIQPDKGGRNVGG
jgi:hypothetical protein